MELDEWLTEKLESCKDPKKPPKLHGNWHLCEYWFVLEKGVDHKEGDNEGGQSGEGSQGCIFQCSCHGFAEW